MASRRHPLQMNETRATIRSAMSTDRGAILGVVASAFATGGRDGTEELDIVHATWGSPARLQDLELVATSRGSVIGHVLVAHGSLSGRPVPGVAPLAVAPEHQGRGVGSALMAEVIARADAAGFPMLVLLGSDRYYARFGFEAAAPLGIVYPPVGASPHFQVRRLARYDPSSRGEYSYCWELP
jgi:putative acetyltransferase